MHTIRRLISALLRPLGLLALVALAVALAWLLGSPRALPGQQVQPTQRVSALPAPTAEPAEQGMVTPDATEETPPPVPTPLPTPMVTPIPVAQPPFIPGLEDVVPQPFHVILREGNAVWMVNGDGRGKRLLIDTESEAGLYLGHHPLQSTEGRRLSWGCVSPDGATLALVVTDLWEVTYKGQPFGWQIYLLDVQTGAFRFLAEGLEPVWSPDGTRIAYVRDGALWVADVESGQGNALFTAKEGYWVRDVSWSPDGRQIACVHEVAPYGDMPEILVISADGGGDVVPLKVPELWAPGNLTWTSDGRAILFIFGTREPTAQWLYNLWMLDIESGGLTQLTTAVSVVSFALSPLSEDWIVLTGQLIYEEERPPYDLWLTSMRGNGVLRLTRDSVNDRDPRWSPDGTQIISCQQDKGIRTLNLADGSSKEVYPTSADFAVTR